MSMVNLPSADSPNAPYSEEAEIGVIGSIIINNTALLDVDFLKPEDFFLLRHNYIFDAMQRLHNAESPIDPITLQDELSKYKQLDDIGGPAYLLQIINRTPTSVYAEMYGRIVERCSTRRKLLEFADKTKALAIDEEMNVEAVLEDVHTEFMTVADSRLSDRGGHIMGAIDDYWAEHLRQMENANYVPGISYGIQTLDKIYRGAKPGEFIVLAGRPGMGKSALMLNIILHITRTLQQPVALFCTELAKREVIKRLVTIISGVSLPKLNDPRSMSQDEDARVGQAVDMLKAIEHLLYIDDTSNPKPYQVQMTAQRLKQKGQLAMLFVDGLYKMQHNEDRYMSAHERYGGIAEAMKNMARGMDIPLMATHQLNREVEKRADKRPLMSDLRESGKIEEEADIVMFAYREHQYDELADPHRAQILCRKYRNGQALDATLYFDGAGLRFMDAIEYQVDLNDDSRDYDYTQRNIDI